MSYVKWSSLWHIVPPDAMTTVCGRPITEDAKFRTLPPWKPFICKVCREHR